MKKFQLSSLVFMMLVVSFVSCKKDSEKQPTKTELVTASPWLFSSASIDQNNDGVGDVAVPPSVLLPCYTDNTLTFKADGTGTFDEGATKCNTTDPQSSPFTWSFTSAEQNITFTASIFPGASGEFKIITLNNTQLIMSRQITLPGTTTAVVVVVTFVH